jgi:hypothetical protein
MEAPLRKPGKSGPDSPFGQPWALPGDLKSDAMEDWKAPSPEEILTSIRREKERILKRPMFGIEVGGKPPFTSKENPAILSGKAKGFGYNNKPEAKVILVPKRNNDGNDSRI